MLSKLWGSPSGPDRIVRNGPKILSAAFLGVLSKSPHAFSYAVQDRVWPNSIWTRVCANNRLTNTLLPMNLFYEFVLDRDAKESQS